MGEEMEWCKYSSEETLESKNVKESLSVGGEAENFYFYEILGEKILASWASKFF